MNNKNIKVLTDKLSPQDALSFSFDKPKPYCRTQIIGGYDLSVDAKGMSQLGEVLFEEENQIVLGGALFTLEKVWGVQSPLTVAYLNDILGIANDGPPMIDVYPRENTVCLFGVGTGGCGDASTAVKDVKFQEREIVDMVPFRVVDTPLAGSEKDKYWFHKELNNGKHAYYLKAFESNPQIKVLWKDGTDDEDGTEVENGVENSSRTEGIETFVEMILNISKKDIREWFEMNGQIDQTRINSIALCTGAKGDLADGTKDYKQVKMFSKLNINNEMLVLAKDLTIIYRVYTS